MSRPEKVVVTSRAKHTSNPAAFVIVIDGESLGAWDRFADTTADASRIATAATLLVQMGIWDDEQAVQEANALMSPSFGVAVGQLLESVAEHVASRDCEAHCEPGGCRVAHAAEVVAVLVAKRP